MLKCKIISFIVLVDPNEVARVIYTTGYYTFDKGDIIDDGNTVQAIKESDK